MAIGFYCFICGKQTGCVAGKDVNNCEICEEKACPHVNAKVPNFTHCKGVIYATG
jgi:hypothetical protein